MGDRSACSFRVFTCPDQKTANGVLDVAREWDAGIAWGEVGDSFTVGDCFTMDELSIGECESIASQLQELGVIAEVMQDGKYEYNGYAIYTHPEWGTFACEADNDGPVMSPKAVDKLIDQARLDKSLDNLLDGLEKISGRKWRALCEYLSTQITENLKVGVRPITWLYSTALAEEA